MYFTVLTKLGEIELVTFQFLHVLRRPTCLRPSCRTYANNSAPEKVAVNPAAAKKPVLGPSACSEDTVLAGLNCLKGQPTPKVYEDDGPGGKLERVKRRETNRQAIKDKNFMLTQ
ncbi:hypothetical protein K443DRAFT_132386 [Laccaria amethystina LaAM-08-1]|uniref:Unplaced genomic scaffold K443scaffold_74, whole genome shotgun sequence n=1 Tax=Laccaria amethystina LaAM-08-1 TaxID=1095629 RepID=A0A0C9WRN2_9AGAR|nr:hypothetical protein K443DRAFT_132386 [Laccaria amethystina LaAM-08-1]